MVTWGLPKDGSYGEMISFLNTQFCSNDRCTYFVAKTTNFVFDIPHN
jgi:hypothetical protein